MAACLLSDQYGSIRIHPSRFELRKAENLAGQTRRRRWRHCKFSILKRRRRLVPTWYAQGNAVNSNRYASPTLSLYKDGCGVPSYPAVGHRIASPLNKQRRTSTSIGRPLFCFVFFAWCVSRFPRSRNKYWWNRLNEDVESCRLHSICRIASVSSWK